jgi:proton-dependent oligopeptide transporter, POT family
MSDAVPMPEATPSQHLFLGHPRGLVILFFTEMWERFSYYGMRALLIFYLTQHFLFSDERSNILYGAYTALVFVMTIVGGTLADHYLGARKAVTFGAILLVLGHCGMAFEGAGSRQIMQYQGADYVLTLDGRGGDANQIVVSERGQSRISFSKGATTLLIAQPELVGLPAAIPTADFSTRVETETFYLNVM